MKNPAAIYRFTFGKRISCCLFFSVIFLNAHGASAFFSSGKINEDLSYRSLHVEKVEPKTKSRARAKAKTKRSGCYLVGEILNNTNIVQEGVSITFYAADFFDHTLWKQTVRIDIADPFYKSGKGCSFRKKLHSCEEPAKFRFKVTGVKPEADRKAIRSKPGPKIKSESTPKSHTKDTDSMATRKKSGSGVVDVITPPNAPPPNYLIILTNGKEIPTDAYREKGNEVFFYKNGGEIQISKEKVAEIRKLD